MPNCIKCGTKLNFDGILCEDCRKEMETGEETPRKPQPAAPVTTPPVQENDSKKIKKPKKLGAPGPTASMYESPLKPDTPKEKPVVSAAPAKPAIPKPSAQPKPRVISNANAPEKKAAPDAHKKTREELQREEYANLMAEYEKSRQEHEGKTAAPPPPKPAQYPPRQYQQPAGPQYYQQPQQRPQYPPPQQQRPNYPPQQQQRPGYPPQQQQPAQGDQKICKRCGYANEKWRLSCLNCKSTLG